MENDIHIDHAERIKADPMSSKLVSERREGENVAMAEFIKAIREVSNRLREAAAHILRFGSVSLKTP
ncbi:hypothetical protein [Mesorhizobium caraganae]|uniref:hypothetical protein n=1 Tax=Mesorhizobium caraganae TaxID=483206 RepID=UPI001785C085|nr:hypothetical protein [Mesorhizobium caraganae]